MRRFLILTLMAATAIPAAAQAQTRELREGRRDIAREQRDLREAQRYGDRRDVREARRDVRAARREYREDVRDFRRDEWRDWRNGNRALYSRGNWRAPYRYTAFRPGVTIGRQYYGQRAIIADPWRYRLPRAQGNLRWVRNYDDVLLVDIRTGRVRDVIRNFYW